MRKILFSVFISVIRNSKLNLNFLQQNLDFYSSCDPLRDSGVLWFFIILSLTLLPNQIEILDEHFFQHGPRYFDLGEYAKGTLIILYFPNT
jgi:hypothetical protein